MKDRFHSPFFHGGPQVQLEAKTPGHAHKPAGASPRGVPRDVIWDSTDMRTHASEGVHQACAVLDAQPLDCISVVGSPHAHGTIVQHSQVEAPAPAATGLYYQVWKSLYHARKQCI